MAIDKIKICAICKKEIKDNDNYCRLTDYFRGEFYCENYFHTQCYVDQIKGASPEQKQMKVAALSTLDKLNKILNKMGGIEKEYEIQ